MYSLCAHRVHASGGRAEKASPYVGGEVLPPWTVVRRNGGRSIGPSRGGELCLVSSKSKDCRNPCRTMPHTCRMRCRMTETLVDELKRSNAAYAARFQAIHRSYYSTSRSDRQIRVDRILRTNATLRRIVRHMRHIAVTAGQTVSKLCGIACGTRAARRGIVRRSVKWSHRPPRRGALHGGGSAFGCR